MTEEVKVKTDEEANKKILGREIFVYHFPPVPHVYSVCPFAIKLESFLRINKIPYQNVYNFGYSSNGTIPYVVLDNQDAKVGEEISDSNVIIKHVCKELKTKEMFSETKLTSQQRAMTHSTIRMLEEHTQQIGFYYRYGLHLEDWYKGLDITKRFNMDVQAWLDMKFPEATKEKAKMRGLTRHNDNDIWEFSFDDIQALSDYLGDSNNKYFFGYDQPTLIDCAVFGHIAQFLWTPLNFPQKTYLNDHCPNLVTYMNEFRKAHWPDWDDLCSITVDYSNGETSFVKKHDCFWSK